MATILADLIAGHQTELLDEWVRLQLQEMKSERGRVSEHQVRSTSRSFIDALNGTLAKTSSTELSGPDWAPVREMLRELSAERASEGLSPTDTANFVFSFKRALIAQLQTQFAEAHKPPGAAPDKRGTSAELAASGESVVRSVLEDSGKIVTGVLEVTQLLDQLGLYTMEVYQKSREEVIGRQQQEMLELSTPVVQLWEGILALPLIGTLDSQRTQIVMQTLLEAIVASNSDLAIIDITGVPTVDTLVAQHLLKTVAAARLMGADCIISGIRPQIAQTIVHLGVDLGTVQTKASLAAAFQLALKKKRLAVTKA